MAALSVITWPLGSTRVGTWVSGFSGRRRSRASADAKVSPDPRKSIARAYQASWASIRAELQPGRHVTKLHLTPSTASLRPGAQAHRRTGAQAHRGRRFAGQPRPTGIEGRPICRMLAGDCLFALCGCPQSCPRAWPGCCEAQFEQVLVRFVWQQARQTADNRSFAQWQIEHQWRIQQSLAAEVQVERLRCIVLRVHQQGVGCHLLFGLQTSIYRAAQ